MSKNFTWKKVGLVAQLGIHLENYNGQRSV